MSDRPTTGVPAGAIPHAVVAFNPGARRAVPGDRLERAAGMLRQAGWRVDVEASRGPGDVTAIARRAAEAGASVVVACGGDGTVNEAVQALEAGGPALAVIPAGTANVWAQEARLPADPGRAMLLVRHGRRRRIDLGVARIGPIERRFLLMCSAGIDGAVIRGVEARPAWKRRLGRAAFGIAAAPLLRGLHGAPALVEANGSAEEVALLLAVAGNTRRYGGVAALTGAARADDGALDLVTLADPSPASGARHARYARLVAEALRGGLDARSVPGVGYRRVTFARIRPTHGALPVQVDGEILGDATAEHPLELAVRPGAIDVIVPRGPNPLFAEGDG